MSSSTRGPGEGSSTAHGSELEVPVYEWNVLSEVADSLKIGVQIPQEIRAYQDCNDDILFIVQPAPEPKMDQFLTYLSTLSDEWSGGRPPQKKQVFIRNMIMVCYNHIASGNDALGCFKKKDVTIKDEMVEIKIHRSKENHLSTSLRNIIIVALRENGPNEADQENNNELQLFLKHLPDWKNKEDLARLYFQPLLCSKLETAYFLLDWGLLADFDGNLKSRFWNARYEGVVQRIREMKEYEKLKKYFHQKQLMDSIKGALDCAKTICHHFNEALKTCLSLEEVMECVLRQHPDLPLKSYLAMVYYVSFTFSDLLSI